MNDAPNTITDHSTPLADIPRVLSILLFLASAVVIFGAILTGYALLRVSDPGAFTWAPKLLDRRLGMIAAASLVVTGLAAAGAFRFATIGKTGPARILLSIALLASVATLAVRVFEIPSTSLRAGLAPVRSGGASIASLGAPAAAVTHVGDASQGKRIFLGTCAACHAIDGSGVKGQGQNLRDSKFLNDKTDDKALAFVKAGRQPFDPESKLHLAMPARGGNPSLTDSNLLDAIAYVRELQKQAAVAAAAPAKAAPASKPAAPTASPDQPQMVDGELWLPHSILPPAQVGPSGSVRATIELQKPGAEGRTAANIRRFFSVLLFVNGLHTIYLLFGMVFAGGLLLFSRAGRGRATASLASAAIYWVVISAIGLFLIPVFYA